VVYFYEDRKISKSYKKSTYKLSVTDITFGGFPVNLEGVEVISNACSEPWLPVESLDKCCVFFKSYFPQRQKIERRYKRI